MEKIKLFQAIVCLLWMKSVDFEVWLRRWVLRNLCATQLATGVYPSSAVLQGQGSGPGGVRCNNNQHILYYFLFYVLDFYLSREGICV